jgi:hypothetical protein
MLATIILDAFAMAQARVIAQALDALCSPDNTSGFASAGVYAFWSVPEQELLYIGLAKNVATRFRQHTGLLACDAAYCKRHEIDAYFQSRDRIGYSIMVQSAIDQPPASKANLQRFADLCEDAYGVDVADHFPGQENKIIVEGLLLEGYLQLCGRLPPWNRIHGAERGRQRRSLGEQSDCIRVMMDVIDAENRSEGNDYYPDREALLQSLTGRKPSDLNAKSSLRRIASDATAQGHEEFLHIVRVQMLTLRATFDDSIRLQLKFNPNASARVEAMMRDDYLQRGLDDLRFAQPASAEKKGNAPCP